MELIAAIVIAEIVIVPWSRLDAGGKLGCSRSQRSSNAQAIETTGDQFGVVTSTLNLNFFDEIQGDVLGAAELTVENAGHFETVDDPSVLRVRSSVNLVTAGFAFAACAGSGRGQVKGECGSIPRQGSRFRHL